jgi:hypothetical protein
MAKAGTKPTRKPKTTSDKEQSERFIETAKNLGATDDAGERFEQAVTAILTNRGKKSSETK